MSNSNNGDEKSELWVESSFRITDLSISPDLSRLVAVGIHVLPAPVNPSSASLQDGSSTAQAAAAGQTRQMNENRLTIYDFESRTEVA